MVHVAEVPLAQMKYEHGRLRWQSVTCHREVWKTPGKPQDSPLSEGSQEGCQQEGEKFGEKNSDVDVVANGQINVGDVAPFMCK